VDRPTVAVLELQAGSLPADRRWLGTELTTAIESGLFRSGAVRLVERRFLEQVFEEISLQLSGAVAEDQVVEVGRLAGARYLVAGEVTQEDERVTVALRLLEVETAEVAGLVEASASSERLAGLTDELVRGLTAALRVESGRAAADLAAAPVVPLRVVESLHRADLLLQNAPLTGVDSGRRRRRSDYMMALDLAERALADQPTLASAQRIKGIALLNLDDPGRAVAAFEQAAGSGGKDATDLVWMANAYAVAGDRGRAMSTARRAMEAAPEDGTAWFLLGRSLQEAGDGSGAVAALLEALERSPGLHEAETNLQVLLGGPGAEARLTPLAASGDGLVETARLYQALWAGPALPDERLVRTVLRLRPRQFLGPYWAGVRAGRSRDHTDAESLLRDALSRNSSGALVHRELGRVLLLSGRCREGEDHVKLYIRNAQSADDLAELQQLIARCKEKKDVLP
jgi:tetratricopeptide (TPR) repeat protein